MAATGAGDDRDHDAFLVALRDRLRNEADTGVILAETTERLAHHFGVNRTGYGEVDESGETFFPRNHWIDGTVVSIDEPLPFAVFGEQITGGLRRGEIWSHESLEDAHLDDAGREICRELGIVSAITVPLMKQGRFVALLSVQQATPRRWSPSDIDLVHEVADRTWATLERARADEARRASEKVLSAIMRHAPIGIYLKNIGGRYELANEEMARVMKQPVEHIAGHTADELLDAAAAADIAAADAEALNGGAPTVRETSRPGADSYEHSLAMRFPIAADDGGAPQLAGFEIDITTLKRTEAELERSREALYQSEKITALGSLLAGVSHELNNPLSIIVAQAELLEIEAIDTPAAIRAGKVRSAANRAARIVQTFLAMARQKRPNRTRVDLNNVVRAALELTGYGLRANGAVVRQSLDPDLPPLLADADQLHQVVVNLIVNAQQALQDWSGERVLTIATAAGPDKASVWLTVSDSGPGIALEVRRRIFEPFFTTKAQDVGTGVGLSFSQGIVEAHEGTLELLDVGPGAAFRVTLPVGDLGATDDRPAESPVAESAGEGVRTALIVDDEPEVAGALGDLLNRLGYMVTRVHSGSAAKTTLATASFDLIVSDVRMPDIDGPALFAWLTGSRPDLVDRVAFSTGDTLSAAAATFLGNAGRPFMEKPFTLTDVRTLVDAVEGRTAARGRTQRPTK